MYNNYFGFRENPFSIAPDPRYLHMSGMHKDALEHLRFGAASKGGIILLTGEAGVGKTTLCRYFLEQIGPTAEIALIVNPGFSAPELLASVWGYGHEGYEHTVNSHINRLRAKIENDPTHPEQLPTIVCLR